MVVCYLLLGVVTILKQLTGLKYTLVCLSSLFNTVYAQGGRGEGYACTSCYYVQLPEEVKA